MGNYLLMFSLFLRVVLILAFMVLCFAPWEAFFGAEVDLSSILEGPSVDHPFGTDNLGRDLLVRISDAFRFTVLPLWGFVLIGFFLGVSTSFITICNSQRWFKWAGQLTGVLAFIFSIVPIGITVFYFSVYFEKNGLMPVIYSVTIIVFAKSYLMLHQLYSRDQGLLYWDFHRSMGGELSSRVWHYGINQHWKGYLGYELAFYLKVSVIAEVSVSYLGFGAQEPNASIGNILSAHFSEALKGPSHVMLVVLLALVLVMSLPNLMRLTVIKLLKIETPTCTRGGLAQHQ